mgnify:CR=1 FL=1
MRERDTRWPCMDLCHRESQCPPPCWRGWEFGLAEAVAVLRWQHPRTRRRSQPPWQVARASACASVQRHGCFLLLLGLCFFFLCVVLSHPLTHTLSLPLPLSLFGILLLFLTSILAHKLSTSLSRMCLVLSPLSLCLSSPLPFSVFVSATQSASLLLFLCNHVCACALCGIRPTDQARGGDAVLWSANFWVC